MANKIINILDNPNPTNPPFDALICDGGSAWNNAETLELERGDTVTFDPQGKTVILCVNSADVFVRSAAAGDTLEVGEDGKQHERFNIDKPRTLTVQQKTVTSFSFTVARALTSAEIIELFQGGGDGEVTGGPG